MRDLCSFATRRSSDLSSATASAGAARSRTLKTPMRSFRIASAPARCAGPAQRAGALAIRKDRMGVLRVLERAAPALAVALLRSEERRVAKEHRSRMLARQSDETRR